MHPYKNKTRYYFTWINILYLDIRCIQKTVKIHYMYKLIFIQYFYTVNFYILFLHHFPPIVFYRIFLQIFLDIIFLQSPLDNICIQSSLDKFCKSKNHIIFFLISDFFFDFFSIKLSCIKQSTHSLW